MNNGTIGESIKKLEPLEIGGDKMLNANGVTVRFGKRVLFEDVNIRFGKGNCYGIIRCKWCW